MSKSQETWNKKEREKKKQKSRKDKEEKKQERKENAKEGKSFDDMLAYIDENGNLSSTPPDPAKKKRINLEDIQIGVPKQGPVDPADAIRKGTVTFFNESKGYGFIKDQETQESIFVHANGLLNQVKENSKVTFEVEMGPKGPGAVRVKLAG
ncbi:MAG: cold shock domain-containing protein [Ginsengibacter sp.]